METVKEKKFKKTKKKIEEIPSLYMPYKIAQ